MNVINPLLYFLHVTAVVLWIGGIGYILFVLMPALPRVALRDRTHFMPTLLKRFLVIVWTAIALIVLSGLYRIFFVWDVTQAGFFTTRIGYVLTAKLILVAALVGVALWVTFRTVPTAIAHVGTHQNDPPDAYQCAQCGTIVGGMRRVLHSAFGLALIIIFLGVLLRGT